MVCQDEDVWMPQEGERAALTMPKQVIVENNAGTRGQHFFLFFLFFFVFFILLYFFDCV